MALQRLQPGDEIVKLLIIHSSTQVRHQFEIAFDHIGPRLHDRLANIVGPTQIGNALGRTLG